MILQLSTYSSKSVFVKTIKRYQAESQTNILISMSCLVSTDGHLERSNKCQVYEAYSNVFEQLKVLEQVKIGNQEGGENVAVH